MISNSTISLQLRRLGNFSPLRYPGGKSSLAGFLDQVIKVNQLYGSVYVEPYAGGAGAALSLLFLEKVEKIVVNDLDPAIYAFWRMATQSSQWVVDQIGKVPLTVEEWHRQKQIYTACNAAENDQLGFALFYLNRTNRSGIVDGRPIGGLSQNGFWKIDARFNRDNLADRFRKIGLYAKRIEVRNEDGISLAREYLTKNEGLVYLDPPYYAKGQCLYLNHYNSDDHSKLAELLNEKKNSSWLLTYDDVSQIRNLYPQRKILDFNISYSAHSAKRGSEIMICSDRLANSVA